MPQPIFISGRVMMEDGTPPPDSVVMERVCNGQAHSEGYTDSKGYFGFELGRKNNGMMHDASEDPGSDPFNRPSDFGLGGSSNSRMNMPSMMGGSDTRFMGCELRARLVGYRSQTVSLAMRRALDNPDVGTILLHRLSPNEGGTVSAISLAAPKDAKKAYEKGLDSLKKKKTDDAVKNFEKAVEVYPKYATAWFELGKLRLAAGNKDSAHSSFESAVQADPKFVAPYIELALIEVQAQKWQEVADITAKAVRLDPFDYPQAHFYNAVANYNLKNVEAAEKSALEVERLDTRHAMPQNLHLLGILLAQRQDYKGAVERLRAYLKFAPPTADVSNVKSQLDQMEKFVAQNPAAEAKQ
jgi:tetratricopeptide (TPR) repeat protein